MQKEEDRSQKLKSADLPTADMVIINVQLNFKNKYRHFTKHAKK